MNHNLHDLETKGFVVLKDFFSESEVSYLLREYQTKRSEIDSKILRSTVPEFLAVKINSLFRDVNGQTDIATDSIQDILTYYDPSHITWGWHQDREPYLLFQNCYQCLNVWFPLLKPLAAESGISLVPMDELSKYNQEFVSSHVLGKGSQGFRVLNNKMTEVENDLSGERNQISIDINELMVTPEMSPGDAIVFRYDVIHRTQVGSHDRVAAAVRGYSGQEIIGLDIIESGISLIEKLFEKKKLDHRRLYLMRDLFLEKNASRLPLSMFSHILNSNDIP